MGVSERRVASAAIDTDSPWRDAAPIELAPGDVLMREGDAGDDVYEVVDGELEILRGDELARIAVVGPGDTVGELAALVGSPRMATVRAVEPAVVRRIDRDRYERWLAEDRDRLAALTDFARARIDNHRTISMIKDLLGVDASVAADVGGLSERVQLEAGEILFKEGDDSDAGYLLVSGRLLVTSADGQIAEVARGEIVGEA